MSTHSKNYADMSKNNAVSVLSLEIKDCGVTIKGTIKGTFPELKDAFVRAARESDCSIKISGSCASSVFMNAARVGDLDLIKLYEKSGAINVNCITVAMAAAAANGHIEIVRLCHEWGADGNTAMAMAAKGGHEAIVRLCHEWGADGNTAMAYAAKFGQEAIVRLCHEWGASNVNGLCFGPRGRGTKQLCGCASSGAPMLIRLWSWPQKAVMWESCSCATTWVLPTLIGL